jgi:signal transduction histidine kinase
VRPLAGPVRARAGAWSRWLSTPAAIVAGGVAAVLLAAALIVISWDGEIQPHWAFLVIESVGLPFIGAGIAAWWVRPDNRIGLLMVLAGLSWYLGNLQDVPGPVGYPVGYLLAYLPLVLFGHVSLCYPDGGLRDRAERLAVLGAYGSYLALESGRYLAEGRAGAVGWAPPGVQGSHWADVLAGNALLFATALVWLVVRRWRAASRPVRQVHAPVWCAILVTYAALAATCLASLLHEGFAGRGLSALYGLSLVAMPFAFLSGLLRARLARLRVADLVVELEQAAHPTRLRDLLAGALGDPSLVLGFWTDEAGYLDAAGDPVPVPEGGGSEGGGPEGGGRVATLVTDGARSLAVLVHDAGLAEQRKLLRAAVAATRLALSNARLRDELRAGLVEVAASRRRIAHAALDERRRIERDLHDGVQQRLLRMSWLAKRARQEVGGQPGLDEVLAALAEEARSTHEQLRELARGIHPAVMVERGLGAAVEELVVALPLVATIDLAPGRWPGAVESTAFFVISEAVVNAVKHADARTVAITGAPHGDRLRVEVRDDGNGGADLGGGTGLRGLRDRVAALGGTLTVEGRPGAGSVITAELPCE